MILQFLGVFVVFCLIKLHFRCSEKLFFSDFTAFFYALNNDKNTKIACLRISFVVLVTLEQVLNARAMQFSCFVTLEQVLKARAIESRTIYLRDSITSPSARSRMTVTRKINILLFV